MIDGIKKMLFCFVSFFLVFNFLFFISFFMSRRDVAITTLPIRRVGYCEGHEGLEMKEMTRESELT